MVEFKRKKKLNLKNVHLKDKIDIVLFY